MKPVIFLVCLVGVFFSGGCATAPKRPVSVEDRFKKADASGDGRVSLAEYQDFMIEEMFAQFDQNGDGFITEAEFVADGGTPKTFREINTSGTGKITLTEAKASKVVRDRVSLPFKEADVNHNGFVTWDEFKTARAETRAYVR